jgi:hypothetical protein
MFNVSCRTITRTFFAIYLEYPNNSTVPDTHTHMIIITIFEIVCVRERETEIEIFALFTCVKTS